MTPEQIELARHALGLDGRKKVSYRNHFVTGPGPGNNDHTQWTAMVESGDAVKRKGSPLTGGDDLFRLTPQGARASLRTGERLDHEDFPEEKPESEPRLSVRDVCLAHLREEPCPVCASYKAAGL